MSLKLPGYSATPIDPERNPIDVSQRYYNEIRVCNLLHRRDIGAVAFVAAYSTESHPFGIIYEYMDGLDLQQFSKHEPYAGRLKLVHLPLHTFTNNCLTFLDNS